MMIIETLKEFGLSDKEANIYATLSKRGPSLASDLAESTGINRSTVYVILGSLSKQWLISERREGYTQMFTAASPDLLVKKAEDSLSKQKELVVAAKKISSELKSDAKTI